jgi:hypothetical protein
MVERKGVHEDNRGALPFFNVLEHYGAYRA